MHMQIEPGRHKGLESHLKNRHAGNDAVGVLNGRRVHLRVTCKFYFQLVRLVLTPSWLHAAKETNLVRNVPVQGSAPWGGGGG